MKTKHYKQMAEIVAMCQSSLGEGTLYENWKAIRKDARKSNFGIVAKKSKGKIIAFGLWHIEKGYIKCAMRAVHPEHRRKGLGKWVTKAIIEQGRRMHLAGYKTYCRYNNYASMNSSIDVGCRIYWIDEYWIYLKLEY